MGSEKINNAHGVGQLLAIKIAGYDCKKILLLNYLLFTCKVMRHLDWIERNDLAGSLI